MQSPSITSIRLDASTNELVICGSGFKMSARVVVGKTTYYPVSATSTELHVKLAAPLPAGTYAVHVTQYTGETYLGICRAIKAAVPDMHIHAFSPLEVTQGAATLGVSIREFLVQLKSAGLNTLPGTAAEILDDEVRAVISR